MEYPTFRDDLAAYHIGYLNAVKGLLTGHTFWLIRMYRRGNCLYRHKIKGIPELIKKRMLRKYACELSPYATIGKNLLIHHSVGIVVGHEVVIGNDCEIFQNVTIGSNRKEKNGRFMPVIGNRVTIGSGAVIVGSITVGDGAVIGANSYVDFDVPPGAVVYGQKAMIHERG